MAERNGVGAEVRAITESAMRGEIDFKESFTRRVALLKGLDVSVMREIAENLPITEGVDRLMSILKTCGYKIAILSGGFTYFGEYLQRRYGIDYVYANELEIGEDGKLTGRYVGEIVDGHRKAELLKLIAQVEKVNLAQTIAVGDGANDLPMISEAGLGIAFHAKPRVVANAEQSNVALLEWFRENGRDLPWRQTRDPYAIWLSEIILQQTQVKQGWEYWERFMHRWPTVEALAAATEDEVLREWQGLGYYSRARNLHHAAKQIVALGHFPNTLEEIKQLKGVGDYTAAAIGSIAFGLPAAVVDGNVYRVLARHFGIDTPINTTEGKKLFAALAQHITRRSWTSARCSVHRNPPNAWSVCWQRVVRLCVRVG